MVIVGIDPGLSGAICFIDREGDFVAVYDMPTTCYRLRDGRKRRKVNAVALQTILEQHGPGLAVVEEVNAYRMGRQSAFGFGWSAAVAHTATELAGVAVIEITPSKWKPRMGIPVGSNKDASRALATGIRGSGADWSRKKDDGRAEAFLLARYGMRLLDGDITPDSGVMKGSDGA